MINVSPKKHHKNKSLQKQTTMINFLQVIEILKIGPKLRGQSSRAHNRSVLGSNPSGSTTLSLGVDMLKRFIMQNLPSDQRLRT